MYCQLIWSFMSPELEMKAKIVSFLRLITLASLKIMFLMFFTQLLGWLICFKNFWQWSSFNIPKGASSSVFTFHWVQCRWRIIGCYFWFLDIAYASCRLLFLLKPLLEHAFYSITLNLYWLFKKSAVNSHKVNLYRLISLLFLL